MKVWMACFQGKTKRLVTLGSKLKGKEGSGSERRLVSCEYSSSSSSSSSSSRARGMIREQCSIFVHAQPQP